jgi:hypothetical protein
MVYVLNYLRVFSIRGVGEVMKCLRVYRVDSPDGEIHLVIDENHVSENSECFIEVAEIKKASKKEAAKPLVLLREE